MTNRKNTVLTLLENQSGTIIGVSGFALLCYLWFSHDTPILINLHNIGLFTTILPGVLAILSWIFGIMGYKKEKTMKMQRLSYLCCMIAIWCFLLDVDLRMRMHDSSSVRDLSAYYSCISLGILLITVGINRSSYQKYRDHEKNLAKDP